MDSSSVNIISTKRNDRVIGIVVYFEIKKGGMIRWTVVFILNMAWLMGIQKAENDGSIPIESLDTSYSNIIVAVSDPVVKALENRGHTFFKRIEAGILHLVEVLASLKREQRVKLT